LKGLQIGLKARGAGIGQVVVIGCLGAQGFPRTGHCHIEHPVHLAYLMLMMV
jgi:hypothetical protein